jgi:hypothetical protein
METIVKLNSKNVTMRELLAIELDSILNETSKIEDISVRSNETLKKQITISTGLTEDEYKNLTIKERLSLVNTFNNLNGLNDFLSQKTLD